MLELLQHRLKQGVEYMTIDSKKPTNDSRIVNEIMTSETKPIYQKPKTFVFLDNTTNILGGADVVLESDGDGYLTS